ncbi:MAG: 4a-hydroxytetrahydrobiopterin dehydratase [Terriglobales bacterium]
MPAELQRQSCQPCAAGTPALAGAELERLRAQLPQWQVVDGHHLHREFRFPDFARALAFVNQVGAIAEREGHHPDLELGWGRVSITTFTHSIAGLSRNDFILAAKIDAVAPAATQP